MARTRSMENLMVWPPTSTTTPAGVASLNEPSTHSPPVNSTSSGDAGPGQTTASATIAAMARRLIMQKLPLCRREEERGGATGRREAPRAGPIIAGRREPEKERNEK